METSILIAQLAAVVYLTVGVGMLVSGDYYRKAFDKMFKEAGIWYLGGLMALISGFLIIKFHNVWEGWPILVTLLGWLALLKGLLIFIFPEGFMDWSAGFVKKMGSQYGFVALVLGLIFGYFGFFA